ncbi:MAG: hypothetical protein HYT87_19830 [Nitrospirae bacterium]|nr:hypothetical protein [Nitrospirota bacterium]
MRNIRDAALKTACRLFGIPAMTMSELRRKLRDLSPTERSLLRHARETAADFLLFWIAAFELIWSTYLMRNGVEIPPLVRGGSWIVFLLLTFILSASAYRFFQAVEDALEEDPDEEQ